MSTVRYTTIEGEVIAEKRTTVRKQYVPDPLGSTIALIQSASNPQTDTFTYWPYGAVASRTGTTPTPYQFVGTAGYYADGSGKMYVRARYLDSSKGRWLTQDPMNFLGGDWYLYRYVKNRPVNQSDPSGLAQLIRNYHWGHVPWHEYIKFGRPGGCDGSMTWGFFPAGWQGTKGDGTGKGIIVGDTIPPSMLPDGKQKDNPSQDPDWYNKGRGGPHSPVLENGNGTFGDALCACIRESRLHPPRYNENPLTGWYVCTDWADDMWDCAYRKLGVPYGMHRPRGFHTTREFR